MNEQREESSESEGAARARGLPIMTRRLILRTPVAEDARPFAEIANNMEIAARMSNLPHPYSERNAESWIAATQANTDPRKISLVITDARDESIVGASGIQPNCDGELEIDYFIASSRWGDGLATEAAQAIIDHVFSVLQAERIIACCHTSNNSSRKVLEKCGFKYSGPGMCACGALNSMVPSEDFLLERRVWKSLKSWST